MLNEDFYIYCIMDDGTYDKPEKRNGAEAATSYAYKCTKIFPEVMITDIDDLCVFHFKNGEILFPDLKNTQQQDNI